MAWITLTMRVTTPLFNGGYQPPGNSVDDSRAAGGVGEAGIRVSSLRGAMRYWFRAMMAPAVGNDLKALAASEAWVFGNTERSSPIRLRIPKPVEAKTTMDARWLSGGDQARWICYLLGQGLSGQGSSERGKGRPKYRVTRPFVAPDTEFDLQLHHCDNQDVAVLALASLWLLCRYGGVGARVRRGFGGLRIVAVEGDRPSQWSGDSLCKTLFEYDESGGITLDSVGLPPELAPCQASIEKATEEAIKAVERPIERGSDLALYPSFGDPDAFQAGLSAAAFAGWTPVLEYAGEQFRWFRAGRDAPEAQYRPKIKTEEWIDAIHGRSNRFRLGALGLPVVYKDGNAVKVRLGDGTEARRASPLWLRPVETTDGQWRLLSFTFLSKFLPHEMKVLREPKKGSLQITDADVRERATRWITNLGTAGHTFIRSQ